MSFSVRAKVVPYERRLKGHSKSVLEFKQGLDRMTKSAGPAPDWEACGEVTVLQ